MPGVWLACAPRFLLMMDARRTRWLGLRGRSLGIQDGYTLPPKHPSFTDALRFVVL